MIKYGSRHEPGHVVGFAGKYYTWWIVSEPQKVKEWYGTKLVQYFNYQQNLSFDKQKALQKMIDNPDVDDFVINEGLRSRSSYSTALSIDYNEDIFLFGKYKGKKFEDVDDSSYKAWYYEETKGTEKESPILKKELEHLYVEFDGEEILIDDLEDKALELYNKEFRRRGHFGTEGEHYENYVRFRRRNYIDTQFGGMFIHEFVDPEGRLIFYKGSKRLDVKEDVVYSLRGKIKHEKYYSKYNGEMVEETSLKYPKVKKEKEL